MSVLNNLHSRHTGQRFLESKAQCAPAATELVLVQGQMFQPFRKIIYRFLGDCPDCSVPVRGFLGGKQLRESQATTLDTIDYPSSRCQEDKLIFMVFVKWMPLPGKETRDTCGGRDAFISPNQLGI